MEIQNEIITTKEFVKDYTTENLARKLIKECYFNGLVADISKVNYNKDYTKRKIKLNL